MYFPLPADLALPIKIMLYPTISALLRHVIIYFLLSIAILQHFVPTPVVRRHLWSGTATIQRNFSSPRHTPFFIINPTMRFWCRLANAQPKSPHKPTGYQPIPNSPLHPPPPRRIISSLIPGINQSSSHKIRISYKKRFPILNRIKNSDTAK